MRRVLVTGGGSGIGRAVARSFADAGDHVTISGRRLEALKGTDNGAGMDCRVVDITNEAQVASLFDQPYNVVVANAGIAPAGPVAKTTLDVWEDTLKVNLTGVFLTFREALRDMEPGGRLIAMASTASLQGGANIAPYVASKHGVLGLVRSLAIEVARKGITCNAVCPGFVDTEIAHAAVENLMQRMGWDEETAAAKLVGRNPMKRMITPDEVVTAVRFLASEDATMINGHALSVSGGEV